ncbi:MAG: hypothetical protein HN341_19240 [Verrucomicrobia bacterium]|nr:hypothetical protein [Verrucomicrobiota bacterium]
MGIRHVIVAVLLVGTLAVEADNTGTDSTNRNAWGENAGWANAGPTNNEVTVHFNERSGWLSGYVWGENVGWIRMGSAGDGPYSNSTSNNWGVNMADSGNLSGYAWGENVGWIAFPTNGNGGVTIDPTTGNFAGHAWGENIGWLKFKGSSPDYGVRTLAFDTQAQGTPNWWLDHHNVTEGYDAGDGVLAWKKYVMDTDPNAAGDYLRITAVTNVPAATDVAFTPASARRYYTLVRCEELTQGDWSNVVGQVAVQYGTPGEKTMQDTNVATQAFYTVEVQVAP